MDVRVASESYIQFLINENEVSLKIEFVNDVGYRFGTPLRTDLFVRTDHWRNILSNKITAISREAAKDVVDIIYLSRTFSFNWIDVIQEAQQKDSWVNELQVSQALNSYPIKKTEAVSWINAPDYERMTTQLKTIAKDILLGADNSLVKNT